MRRMRMLVVDLNLSDKVFFILLSKAILYCDFNHAMDILVLDLSSCFSVKGVLNRRNTR